MTLDDTVIVTSEQVASLYKSIDSIGRRSNIRHGKQIKSLEDTGLLPLTVKTFTSEIGDSLLEFATWVYFSGKIRNDFGVPTVSGKEDFLNYLVTEHFNGLPVEFRFVPKKLSTDIYPLKNKSGYAIISGGSIGRLIHEMGVPILERGSRKSPNRKAYHSQNLPHYFWDIAGSEPTDEGEVVEQDKLLTQIVRILVTDRIKSSEGGNYFQLNLHPDFESANAYANEVIRFLNTVCRGKNGVGVFNEGNIRINPRNNLFSSKIFIGDEQAGYLTRKGLARLVGTY